MNKIYVAMIVALMSLTGCGSKEKPAVQNAAPATSEAIPQKASAVVSNAAVVPQGTGSLRGAVRVVGIAPDAQPLQMGADPYCAANADAGSINESLMVNPNKTLKNAFVYIKSGLEGRTYIPPAAAAVLDQKGCRYHPHMIGLQVGQPLEIVNSDSTLHNVHGLPKDSQEFNLGMPLKGMKIKRTFSAPEIGVKVRCDIHPWMLAYACVLPHPFFAVTGEDGSFELKNLPVGQYTLAVWHETMGAKEISVTVGEGETIQDVSF